MHWHAWPPRLVSPNFYLAAYDLVPQYNEFD